MRCKKGRDILKRLTRKSTPGWRTFGGKDTSRKLRQEPAESGTWLYWKIRLQEIRLQENSSFTENLLLKEFARKDISVTRKFFFYSKFASTMNTCLPVRNICLCNAKEPDPVLGRL